MKHYRRSDSIVPWLLATTITAFFAGALYYAPGYSWPFCVGAVSLLASFACGFPIINIMYTGRWDGWDGEPLDPTDEESSYYE